MQGRVLNPPLQYDRKLIAVGHTEEAGHLVREQIDQRHDGEEQHQGVKQDGGEAFLFVRFSRRNLILLIVIAPPRSGSIYRFRAGRMGFAMTYST